MKILIIGGGFAGCSSAEILSNNKNSITLVEKASFLGVRTFFYGGHPYTFGLRHFLTKHKHVYQYLKKFLKLRIAITINLKVMWSKIINFIITH